MAHMTHRLPRSRHRRILEALAAAGGLDAVIKSSNGWLVDWLLQETEGAVAGARNRAVALGRNWLVDSAGTGIMTAANWTVGNSATLANPSAPILRVTRNGAADPFAKQDVQDLNVEYTITGETRSDGNAIPRIFDGTGSPVFTGTNSTSWQTVDIVVTPNITTSFEMHATTAVDTEYTEWRNMFISQTDIAASSEGLGLLDGDHTGVTVGVAGNGRGIRYAARYDGATTYTDIYSAELNSMFNPSRGTLTAWARVSGAGVWTDGDFRRICYLAVDDNNRIFLDKLNANNTLRAQYVAGTVSTGRNFSGVTTLDLFMLTITWDTVADEVIVYFNAEKQGATVTGLGAWVGNLDPTQTVIGATTTIPTFVWDGDIAYVSLNDQVLTQSEITAQYQAGN